MALTAGTRLGPYEIAAQIGVGGMGEVYRARDTKLDRDVAIKVLPESLAGVPERIARFQREAKTLAALNHPNIAAIYGLEEADSTKALVMELVEGPTLADRIAKGAIPVDEALPIAKQIAEALEAAHEQGIIHRDLKPANVKLRPDGVVKVLDFGLAKALEPSGSDVLASQSPTITTPAMTQAGMILGTAAYMSPEQARGKTVDKRTDIWAFGAVLFEILTGKRAFSADEVSDTLALVLTQDLDWRALPTETPVQIRQLLGRCMEKDARRRLRDVGEARLVLEGGLDTGAWQSGVEAVPGGWRGSRRALLPWAVAGVALLIASVATWWPGPVASNPTAVRFAINISGELPPRVGHLLALSPDGLELVYKALTEEGDQLYRRPMNGLEAVPVRGSVGAGNPFFSPDGQWLAFGTPDGLKKVSLAGEPPTTICECSAFGATWGPDQTIVFTDGTSHELSRVSSTGGDVEPLTELQSGETFHDEPAFLPDGDAVLFTVSSGSLDTAQIAVVSLETGQRKMLGSGFFPRYSPTGHLLYAQTGASLWAVPFDASRLEITGDAVPVLENVRIEGGSSVQFRPSGERSDDLHPGGHG